MDLEPFTKKTKWWNRILSKVVDASYEKTENYSKLGIQYIHFKSPLVYFFRLKNTILLNILPRMIGLQIITLLFYLLWVFKIPIPWPNSTAHSLLSIALGMLIVFKTNASYDRYYEGRRQWGIITSNCISLFMSIKPKEANGLEKLANLLCAFVYTIKNRLRGCELCHSANPFLNEKQIQILKDFENPPIQILYIIRKWIEDNAEKCNIDNMINNLISAQESCDRILSVAIPYCFICHVHHILTIYLITLPYVMISQYEFLTFLFVGLISFSLLGVESAASEIADPFGNDRNDLPLDFICESLQKQLFSVVNFPSTTILSFHV